jgi:site-specific DNA recombinase
MVEITIRNKRDFDEKVNDEILRNSFNVYCRVSTTSQIENTSLQTQKEYGIQYVTNNHQGKFKYIVIWSEEGKSGDDGIESGIGEVVRRELLSIILNGWEEGVIKNFWVSDLSRLSRNNDSSMVIKQKMFKHGIDLYVENSKYDFDSKQDKLMFQILSSFNEFENTMRFEKGLVGKRRNLDEGKWWGGTIPFGLKSDGNGKVVECEKNGKWVRRVFSWYNDGLSIIKITDRLTRLEGVKTQRGKEKWNVSSVNNLLSNTFYLGYKEYKVKGIKGKTKEYCESKGMLHTHRFECESIVDKEVFDYTQKIMSKRKHSPNTNNKHQFLLKNLLYCEGCGKMMRGKVNLKQHINIYFCVSNEEKYRNPDWVMCNTKKDVNREVLEELVWVKVLEVFKNSESVKEEYRTTNLPKGLDSVSIKKKIKSNQEKIKTRLKNIESTNERLVDGEIKHTTGKWSDTMLERYNVGVEEQLEKLNGEISQLEIQNRLWLNDNVWEDWFDSFKLHFNKICKYKNFEDKQKFLTDYVEKIYVGWDEDTNTHNLKIQFVLNIVKDRGELLDNDIYKVKRGVNKVDMNGINIPKIKKIMRGRKSETPSSLNYSTVADSFKKEGFNSPTTYKHNHNSVIVKFNLLLKSSKLTKTSHYSPYQQKLYDEVKSLKEEYNLGYRRISYLIYDKGYRGIRGNQVLRNNDIYSIYRKGKVREGRINRDFESVVKDVKVYESVIQNG